MPLSIDKIINIIKQPKNATHLKEVLEDEKRLNALCNGDKFKECILSKWQPLFANELTSVVSEFKPFAKSFLSLDTSNIFAHYSKVFETEDGIKIETNFDNKTDDADYLKYRNTYCLSNYDKEDGINVNLFFKDYLLSALLYQPNSVLVIDFENNKNSNFKPTPKIQLVPPKHITDIDVRYSDITYLLLSNPEKEEYYYYDNEYYAIVKKTKKNYEFKSEPIAHNLGYTPCFFISKFHKYSNNYIIKKSPISDVIDIIEDWTLEYNMFEYFIKQNLIPVSFSLDTEKKEIEDVGENNYNADLIIYNEYTKSTYRKKILNNTFGKNVKINIDVFERLIQDNVNFKESFGYTNVDSDFIVNILEKFFDRKKQEIIDSIIGIDRQGTSRASFNKEQLQLTIEDKRSNLEVISSWFEQLQTSIENKVALIRYPLSFINLNVEYGRDYFPFATNLIEELGLLFKNSGDILTKLSTEITLRSTKVKNDVWLQFAHIIQIVIPYLDIPYDVFISNIDKYKSLSYNDTIIRIYASQWIYEFMMFELSMMTTNHTIEYRKEKFEVFINNKILEHGKKQNTGQSNNGKFSRNTNSKSKS